MLLYEVFKLLSTHVTNPKRTTFSKGYILSVRSKITTNLRRKVLESSMKDGPETSCDDILKTLSHVYEESITKQVAVPVSDEVEPREMDADVAPDSSTRRTSVTFGPSPRRNKRDRKHTMNALMGRDVWSLGMVEFKKKRCFVVEKR